MRAARALARQLEHQGVKAVRLQGRETEFAGYRKEWAEGIRKRIDKVRPIPDDARVLEIGSGAHGLIFFLDFASAVGVDPLARQYRRLFPHWQGEAMTVAARGEALPFEDRSFDLVLCDNVVDHSGDPGAIVREISRVLRLNGLLYFTVNVHHWLYAGISRMHNWWNDLGITIEIGPFADHTAHFTPAGAQALFCALPLRLVEENLDVEAAKESARRWPLHHPGDLVKRFFYKNAPLEIIAQRV